MKRPVLYICLAVILSAAPRPQLAFAGDPAGPNFVQVVVADFNGDGTSRNALNYGAGSEPTALPVGDLNRDSKPDLVIADQAGTALVMLNTYTPSSDSSCSAV